ncbi:phage baseplate assembly protein V [Pseudoalteromonas umbrosa]|uniref:phage baseplate assembly protein V n=1 Tax=Pseudoalteromonas umbrosa TaxID=3048489 RepID=UPI0024C3F5D6|nr:phage baseplate assembly protein V [Pseudoalteromonas sp. B95]MDK1287367.1 phage baseplate assembly protein V [Pseudoalteromonas sp. B95]
MLANQQQSELAVSDMQHRFAKLISIGTVEEVDYDLARVKVRIGEWLTAKLPWLTNQAAQDMTWQAPEVGEQVLVLSPSGDMAQGIVLGSLYANGHEQPHFKMNHVVDATSTGGALVQALSAIAPESREHVHRAHYQDGAIVQYDRENHAYDIFVPQTDPLAKINIYSGGDINVECHNDTNITIGNNATVEVGGAAQVDVTGTADVTVGDNVSVSGGANIDIVASGALNLTGDSVSVTSTGSNVEVLAAATLKLNGAHISAQE